MLQSMDTVEVGFDFAQLALSCNENRQKEG